jgi:alkanesulfonate monooxygenase SsuD/methylene tetrahydromethanopterin reductase-like flavin-dependent oxidoreductase (luciferase family)
MHHAAAWADVWYPTGPADDPDLKRAVPAFQRMVAEAGRDPDGVRVGLAPAAADAARLERLAANGVDECNVAVLGAGEAELLRNLDALTAARKQVFGS